MKVAIAESSISATNLTNALQSINREKERISENVVAVDRFEICKKLRRKILRYVSMTSLFPLYLHASLTDRNRSISSKMNSGSVAFCTLTMNSFSL